MRVMMVMLLLSAAACGGRDPLKRITADEIASCAGLPFTDQELEALDAERDACRVALGDADTSCDIAVIGDLAAVCIAEAAEVETLTEWSASPDWTAEGGFRWVVIAWIPNDFGLASTALWIILDGPTGEPLESYEYTAS